MLKRIKAFTKNRPVEGYILVVIAGISDRPHGNLDNELDEAGEILAKHLSLASTTFTEKSAIKSIDGRIAHGEERCDVGARIYLIPV